LQKEILFNWSGCDLPRNARGIRRSLSWKFVGWTRLWGFWRSARKPHAKM
jgi:hypothetical protein